MPLWLNERMNGKSIEYIATVPLASFVASFIAALVFRQSSRVIGHRVGYLVGSFISLMACVLVVVPTSFTTSIYMLYLTAAFYGAGSSVTMIASLCITADMIGPHTSQGGKIYSTVTFCDKLITGIAVFIIETM
jgi:Na+/melibiose symporter-like transporter